MSSLSLVVMALGIGLPTLMYTIVSATLLDLPVPEGDRIVQISVTDVREGRQWSEQSYRTYTAFEGGQSVFEGMGAFFIEDVTLSGGATAPRRLDAAYITPGFSRILRVPPMRGAAFGPDDGRTGQPLTVMIGHDIWHDRFGGGDVIGDVLVIDGAPHEIVAVMPAGFGFPYRESVWIPLPIAADGSSDDDVVVFGRLAEGVTEDSAGITLTNMISSNTSSLEGIPEIFRIEAGSYARSQFDPDLRAALWSMLGAVIMVLLLACSNLGGLLLTRSIRRRPEYGIRAALGAGRRRLVALVFTEALMITLFGGIAGLIVIAAGMGIIDRTVQALSGFYWVEIGIRIEVVLFVLGSITLSALAASLLPVLELRRQDLIGALREQRSSGTGRWTSRVNRTLVITEISLSCALLLVAGMLVGSALRLRSIDLGIPAEEILTGEVEISRRSYPTDGSRIRFFEELEARLAAIPGVAVVSMTSDVPATGGYPWPMQIDGVTRPGEEVPRLGGMTVTPDFLEVFDIEVIAGRGFLATDGLESEPVVLVNRAFVERYYPDGSAVGRTVRLGSAPDAPPRTIIGVVPNLFVDGLDSADPNGPGFYMPFNQNPHISMQAMVRTRGDMRGLAGSMQEVLKGLDPTIAMSDLDRVDRLIALELADYDLLAGLFLFFGLVALLLAAAGLYGVISSSVDQRTSEWGLRMALGSTGAGIVRLVVRRGSIPLLIGLAIGSLLGRIISGPIAESFDAVDGLDPTAAIAVFGLLLVTGSLASFIPALRAVRIEPSRALTSE